MNIEIPEFLLEISKQLNEQDNRCTSDPLFEVRYKDYLATEEGYNEHHYEIFDDDDFVTYYRSDKDDDYTELATYLWEHDRDWCKTWLYDMADDIAELDSFIDHFNDTFDEYYHDLPENLKKLHMQEIEVTVNSHFTEKGAQQFIDRKQHDYKKLYIYAISLYHSEQMKQLRNWMKDLTTQQGEL